MSRVDELVVETAIHLLKNGAKPVGINVSAIAICNPAFTQNMVDLIGQNMAVAPQLYFEIPEQGAFDHLSHFKNFCHQIKALGCKIGIEHFGSKLSRLGELHDVGLDYIKIDVSVIRDINSNEANKNITKRHVHDSALPWRDCNCRRRTNKYGIRNTQTNWRRWYDRPRY